MNKTKITVSSIIVVLLIIIAYLYLTKSNNQIKVGATNIGVAFNQLIEDSQPYYRNNGGMLTGLPIQTNATLYARQGVVEGTVNSTSTPASMTLAPTDILKNTLLNVNLSVGAATITFPASTTLNAVSFLPNIGDADNLYIIQNATSTTGANGLLTISGGTGTILQIATSTFVSTIVLGAGQSAECSIYREVDTDYTFFCVPSIN